MAIINKTGIGEGNLIEAEHITRAIDALSGVSSDTIIATGSFTGSFTGAFNGSIVSASYSATASYVNNSISSSFSSTASYVQNAQTASYVTPLNQSLIVTGSVTLSGSATSFLDEVRYLSALSISSGGSTYSPAGLSRITFRVDGTTSSTLQDGTNGQILNLICTTVSSAGTHTINVTNSQGFNSINFINAGETATLIFLSGNWYILSLYGAIEA